MDKKTKAMMDSVAGIDARELALIAGEPLDPKKPLNDVVSAVCEFDTAEPEDYYYHFDVLEDTDKVYVVTSTGTLTQEEVTPDTPVLLSFIDLVTPEYYVKLTELAKAKERTIARKVKTINRAMDAWEIYRIITLIDQAATNEGNTHTIASGQTKFTYDVLVCMIDDIIDYADGYKLVVGATVDKDIKLWDYDQNKNQSVLMALQQLNVDIMRVNHSVTIDSAATNVVGTLDAYLVGTNTVVGKPILFVRKKLDSIDLIGGVVETGGGDKPQRLVFTTPNPVPVGASNTRTMGVGFTGYEEVTFATSNPKAMSKFNRS